MVYTVTNRNVHNTYTAPTSTQQVSNTYDYKENVNGAYILGNYHNLATNYNTGVQEIALQNLNMGLAKDSATMIESMYGLQNLGDWQDMEHERHAIVKSFRPVFLI